MVYKEIVPIRREHLAYTSCVSMSGSLLEKQSGLSSYLGRRGIKAHVTPLILGSLVLELPSHRVFCLLFWPQHKQSRAGRLWPRCGGGSCSGLPILSLCDTVNRSA